MGRASRLAWSTGPMSFQTVRRRLQAGANGSTTWASTCAPRSQELCSRLENYGRSRQRRRPYFVNSRLIKAADEFKDKTTAINPRMTAATATQNASKRFHPGLCPSQRGPEFAGEGAEIQQQSQAERQPCWPGHAFESCFWSVAPGPPRGGRWRNAKRPGALTGIDLAEVRTVPAMSSGKGSDAHGHGSALGAFATLSAAVWSLTCSRPVRTKRQDTRGSRDLRRAATVRVPPLARRLSRAAVGSRALPLKYRRAAGKTSCSASTATFRIIASLRLPQA